MFERFEAWTKKVYKPKEARWKRPALLCISIIILIACFAAGYTQLEYQWTNNGVWWVIGIFSFLSVTGLVVSIFCKDYWVALVLGGV